MTDIALGLDRLVPGARYSGSLTANTADAYAALTWEDERAKPSLADVRAAGAPAPTADDVREEASRRMQVLLGARDAGHLSQTIQNGQREAERLNTIRAGIPGVLPARDWTADEAARAAALWAADRAIEAIRAASNAMEAAPPSDYADDARWPPPAPTVTPAHLLKPSSLIADQIRYETALRALNGSAEAISLLNAEAQALSLTVAVLASRIVQERHDQEVAIMAEYARRASGG